MGDARQRHFGEDAVAGDGRDFDAIGIETEQSLLPSEPTNALHGALLQNRAFETAIHVHGVIGVFWIMLVTVTVKGTIRRTMKRMAKWITESTL